MNSYFFFVCVSQEKRSAFPRFYFIGDDDLLEILGQATNPTVIQSHLKKLFAGHFHSHFLVLVYAFVVSYLFFSSFFFPAVMCIRAYFAGHGKAISVFTSAGIHSVVFDDQCQHIVAMCSLEGEIVPLRNLVRISSLVEVKFICLKTG